MKNKILLEDAKNIAGLLNTKNANLKSIEVLDLMNTSDVKLVSSVSHTDFPLAPWDRSYIINELSKSLNKSIININTELRQLGVILD